MVNEKHLTRVLHKAERLETLYGRLLFTPVGEVTVGALACEEHLYAPPATGYAPISRGDKWGTEWSTLWLRGSYTVPDHLAGKPLYVLPRLGGWEGFLYLDGAPHAIFTTKYTVDTHGNHWAARITAGTPAGTALDLAFEYYAGHNIPGCQPYEDTGLKDFSHTFEEIAVCVKNPLVSGFVFDLHVLCSLVRALPEDSFRRGDVVRGLCEVVDACVADPFEHTDWQDGLTRARDIMRPLLAAKNAASAPITPVVGHSHMDTAWLWPVDETVRKCARTYANALALMEEYPEFRFFQSSSCHSEMIRRHYPALFERIREKVREGRYEPGGAVWIECDCNITSGESIVRQFLWGQKYTEKHFGFRSNNFWLPDTFGYSAAIPQIMKGCGVDYFFTTKLSWNDTTVFPYDSFYWEGLDGTRVFTHFNATHCYPDPETLGRYTAGAENFTQEIKNKTVSRRKLIAYGYGDGGGGPEFESIEYTKREVDLDGCPKTEHCSVQEFGRELERESKNAPVHHGELYLELHRGTLTSKHQIKRNNRKGEQALHDLEVLTCLRAVQQDAPADDAHIRPHMETLLKNQFHDILPGSCIERAHTESIAEMGEMIASVRDLQRETLAADGAGYTVFNPLGFARDDTVYFESGDVPGQTLTDVFGRTVTAVEGLSLPAFGAYPPTYAQAVENSVGNFIWDENTIETPFYRVIWDENGGLASLFDKRADREVRSGLPLGTLLLAEDVPYMWDNWDIDPDMENRFAPTAQLIRRELVSAGESQIRFRCTYRLTALSTLTQDVVFYARRPIIEFHSRCDWNDKHLFLKAAFDTDIRTDFSTHEIQFGALRRPTTRNNAREQAMFETCSHKYTDLSEPRYGVSMLSDCKYGVSVRGGSMRLSLHKGGLRPDDTGDSGVHDFSYALLPHVGALCAEETVRAAYCLNNPPIVFSGAQTLPETPIRVENPNIIIESIKPLHETAARAFAVRLYECEGCRTNAALTLAPYITRAEQSNLLEEVFAPLEQNALQFHPFEIKTLILHY